MKLLIPLLFAFFLTSCIEISSVDEIAEMEIEDILSNVKTQFNSGNIEEIMQNYHPDFSHDDGEYFQNYEAERQLWELRYVDYYSIDFTDIEIDLNNDEAIVTLKMSLDEDIFEEPEDNGDLSYFYFTNLGWKIGGNNFSW